MYVIIKEHLEKLRDAETSHFLGYFTEVEVYRRDVYKTVNEAQTVLKIAQKLSPPSPTLSYRIVKAEEAIKLNSAVCDAHRRVRLNYR